MSRRCSTAPPRRVAAIGLLALLLPGGAAHAWESSAKWGVNVVGYRINPANNDGLTSSQVVTALRFGADAWTQQTRAAFRFRYDGTSTSTTVDYNDANLILFRNAEGTSATTRATAYTWKLNNKIVEADIVFWDKSLTFIVGAMPCSKEVYVENTAIHELGHALGLDHSTVTTATMWSTEPACSKARLALDPDDKAGAVALYPCSSSSQCNDGLLCTSDSCLSNKCQRTAIAGCCTLNSQCTDSSPCTKDTCSSNKCAHAPIAGCCTLNSECTDSSPCTRDTCSSNKCAHAPIAGCCTLNSQCADDNPCTRDTCSSNKCAHAPVACDAGVPAGDAPLDVRDAAVHPADGAAAAGDSGQLGDAPGPRRDAPTGGGDATSLPDPRQAAGGCSLGSAADPAGAHASAALLLALLLAGPCRRRAR